VEKYAVVPMLTKAGFGYTTRAYDGALVGTVVGETVGATVVILCTTTDNEINQ
jgi:hypothetical protein